MFQCWDSIGDAGPALKQRLIHVPHRLRKQCQAPLNQARHLERLLAVTSLPGKKSR